MINTAEASNKKCSCATGKSCSPCRAKKPVRVIPQVRIESSSPLPVPFKIATYKEPATTVNFLFRKKKERQERTTPPKKGTKICEWYKRRQALRKLKKLAKQEREWAKYLQHEKARAAREAEFIEQYSKTEKYRRELEQANELSNEYYDQPKQSKKKQSRYKGLNKFKKRKKEYNYEEPLVIEPKKRDTKNKKVEKKEDPVKIEPVKEKKIKTNKIKATNAKPAAESRCVATKKGLAPACAKQSFNDRFSNFCYRICCQFYCCVSILMIVGLIIIFTI